MPCKEKTLMPSQLLSILLSLLILGLLFEIEEGQILLLIIRMNPNVGILQLFFSRREITITPVACILSLIVYQISSCSLRKKVLAWLPILLILISNDIHLNPGPQSHFQNNFFNFMNWNLNSLTKDNFHRVDLIEAQNSIFNYDLISVCETNLNDSVILPETLLNDYTFEPANHPWNVKHGGVGLFKYKFPSC